MPESEMAKRMTKLIKATDKLVRDLKKGAEKLCEAARELRGGENKDEPE